MIRSGKSEPDHLAWDDSTFVTGAELYSMAVYASYNLVDKPDADFKVHGKSFTMHYVWNMAQDQIPQSCFTFLNALKQNNNREWFEQHKADYLEQIFLIENFAQSLLGELNKHDVIENPSGKKSLYRIYRDIRFAKVKIPFKTHWGGHFTRASRYRRGGYYFHLETGNSFVLGGFNAPNSEDLKRIREEIAYDDKPLRTILSSPVFRSDFGMIKGEQLLKSPKGFDADHPAIDLLRFKQFRLIRRFSDEEVLSSTFVFLADQAYRNMRPFLDYMSDILTTDVNGIKI